MHRNGVRKLIKQPYIDELFYLLEVTKHSMNYLIVHQFMKCNFRMAYYELFGKSKYVNTTSVIKQL